MSEIWFLTVVVAIHGCTVVCVTSPLPLTVAEGASRSAHVQTRL